MNYSIRLKCCFCGGGIEIDEASRSTLCSHCGSVLRIERGTTTPVYYIKDETRKTTVKFMVDRHLKREKRPLSSRWDDIIQVHVPFWRLQGTYLSIRERRNSLLPADHFGEPEEDTDERSAFEVKIGPKEVTICANSGANWGLDSLGVRSQVVSISPVDSESREQNHFAPLTLTEEAARERFISMSRSVSTAVSGPGTEIVDRVFSVRSSIIFFPIWCARFSSSSGEYDVHFDPLANRVISLHEHDSDLKVPRDSSETVCDAQLVPHRCPNCAADLPVRERSCVCYCSNCRRLYSDSITGYRQLDLRVPADIEADSRLMPFWVFSVPDDGSILSILRLLQFRNDRLIIPAFDISNPARMLRLVTHFNRRDDQFELVNRLPARYSLVDVVAEPESVESMIPPLLTAIKLSKGYKPHEAPLEGDLRFDAPELIWLPFSLDKYFWIEKTTGAAIEKAAVRI